MTERVVPENYSPAEILDLIRSRESRIGRDGIAAALGIKMVKAARDFVRLPSSQTLEAFKLLEDEWRTCHPKARRRFAHDFRRAFGIGDEPPSSYAGNTPYNKNWNPVRGFVYGLWSEDYYGLIKLGATTQHPTDRLVGFKRKYQLRHLAVVFFFEVSNPASVERHWTSYLASYRRSVGRNGSREWYQLTPATALRYASGSVESSGVRRYDTNYVMKNIETKTEVEFWPSGPKRFGAHIISKQ